MKFSFHEIMSNKNLFCAIILLIEYFLSIYKYHMQHRLYRSLTYKSEYREKIIWRKK